MFKSTFNRGLQMTFENGITISIQFGTGNYCERRSFNADFRDEMRENIISSRSAEIAIWHKDSDTWFDFGHDQVKGFCSANEVALWITRCAVADSIESLSKYSEKPEYITNEETNQTEADIQKKKILLNQEEELNRVFGDGFYEKLIAMRKEVYGKE